MIKVKHPKESCNEEQAKLLRTCPKSMRRYHELAFNYGNAAYRYHFCAQQFNPTEEDYLMWLGGLPANIRNDMQQRGFDYCKTTLPFTHFVNEKNDVGMEEYIRDLMGNDLFTEYKSIIDKE